MKRRIEREMVLLNNLCVEVAACGRPFSKMTTDWLAPEMAANKVQWQYRTGFWPPGSLHTLGADGPWVQMGTFNKEIGF